MINNYFIRKCAMIVEFSVVISFYWSHKFLENTLMYIPHVDGVMEIGQIWFIKILGYKKNSLLITNEITCIYLIIELFTLTSLFYCSTFIL